MMSTPEQEAIALREIGEEIIPDWQQLHTYRESLYKPISGRAVPLDTDGLAITYRQYDAPHIYFLLDAMSGECITPRYLGEPPALRIEEKKLDEGYIVFSFINGNGRVHEFELFVCDVEHMIADAYL